MWSYLKHTRTKGHNNVYDQKYSVCITVVGIQLARMTYHPEKVSEKSVRDSTLVAFRINEIVSTGVGGYMITLKKYHCGANSE